MLTFRLFLVAGLIILAFSSCKKEGSSNSTGTVLKMIKRTERDSIFYRIFQYDNQQRLTSILDSNNNGNKRRFDIFYDSQGKLFKVTEDGNLFTFEFDDKGRIIKKIGLYSGQAQSSIQNTYKYDINGRVIADSMYSYWTQTVYSTISYSYDQNNNVTEAKFTKNSFGATLGQLHSTYDNHLNPLSETGSILYILSGGYELPTGKNNLVKAANDDGTIVNFIFEYYSNGLPKKSTEHISNDDLITYTEYYYE